MVRESPSESQAESPGSSPGSSAAASVSVSDLGLGGNAAERHAHLARALADLTSKGGGGDGAGSGDGGGEPARVLVLTHKSPDPDALGACVGARFLLERGFGLTAEISTIGRIHRAENVAMVRELGLAFDDYGKLDFSRYRGAVLLDTQPTFGHTIVPEDVELLAVFDHHIPPKGGPGPAVRHRDVRTELGATSSMVYEYIRAAGLELDRPTATALFCGVRFDTGDLSHNVTALDEEAYLETFRRSDRECLARIQKPRLPMQYYRELHRSLRMARRHGPAVLALLGQVLNPESVAEMADFFLRMEGCRWALVGGAYEGQYYLSLRTQPGAADAYTLLAKLLEDEGSFGGHGRVAGGRVSLEEGEQLAIRRLERRLRARALGIVDPDEELDEESRLGRCLT